MWKDFFYFSKADKRAILLLVGIIVILITIYGLSGTPVINDTLLREEKDREIVEFLASVKEKEQQTRQWSHPYKEKNEPAVLTEFDPNLADSIEFIRMGLPPFMARNILRYRAKGGVFRTPESFAKIYGMDSARYHQLLPYIRISQPFQPIRRDTLRQWQAKKDSVKVDKYPQGTVVDINLADTTELKKIPGLGSSYASSIVAYRRRLGGFYMVEQLLELPFLSKEMLVWFKVESPITPSIQINRWGVERLRQHPYLNFYQAKVIVEHRRKYGKLKSLPQLKLYEEFTEEDFERLSHYVSFE